MRRSIYVVCRCVYLSFTLCAKRIYGHIVPALRSHRLSTVCMLVCLYVCAVCVRCAAFNGDVCVLCTNFTASPICTQHTHPHM